MPLTGVLTIEALVARPRNVTFGRATAVARMELKSGALLRAAKIAFFDRATDCRTPRPATVVEKRVRFLAGRRTLMGVGANPLTPRRDDRERVAAEP